MTAGQTDDSTAKFVGIGGLVVVVVVSLLLAAPSLFCGLGGGQHSCDQADRYATLLWVAGLAAFGCEITAIIRSQLGLAIVTMLVWLTIVLVAHVLIFSP